MWWAVWCSAACQSNPQPFGTLLSSRPCLLTTTALTIYLASTTERRVVKLALVPDTGAEVKGKGAGGTSTMEPSDAEGRLLAQNTRALINTSMTTTECAMRGPPSSAETQEEEEDEEGASLLEGATAPSDSSKTAPEAMAGDTLEKSQKKVRLFGAVEQGLLVTCCSLGSSSEAGLHHLNPAGLHWLLLPVFPGKLEMFVPGSMWRMQAVDVQSRAAALSSTVTCAVLGRQETVGLVTGLVSEHHAWCCFVFLLRRS